MLAFSQARSRHGDIRGKRPAVKAVLSLSYFALTSVLLPIEVLCGDLKILSREQWRAQPAKEAEIVETRVEKELIARGPTSYLTVHHTQERATQTPLPEKLRKHQSLMFQYYIDGGTEGRRTTTHIFLRDTPYHFLIDASGKVAEGRELRFAAYSNTKYLTPIEQHITVVLEGDFNRTQPTGAQMQSLVELLADLAERYRIKLANVGYHQDVVAKRTLADGSVQYGTDCPGKNLIARFGEIKAQLAKRGIQ